MASTFNGFEEGESRTRKNRPRKAEAGHSLVRWTVIRRGSAFRFSYEGECQCGKVYRSARSPERVLQSWRAHLKREGVQ